MIRRSYALACIGLAGILGAALVGCTPKAGPATVPSPMASETAAPADDAEIEAVWLDGGRMIGLVTRGSSTCVPVGGEVTVSGDTIAVELVLPPGGGGCTMDYAIRATAVATPEGVDPAQDYEVVVTGEVAGDADLDGEAGLDGPGSETDFLPTAAWSDDSSLVILSWGSSGCVPRVEMAKATSPEDVTVTFATLPEDTVCTTDMAPRVVVAWVEGAESLDDDATTYAIMEGAEFDNIRIPIVGSD